MFVIIYAKARLSLMDRDVCVEGWKECERGTEGREGWQVVGKLRL